MHECECDTFSRLFNSVVSIVVCCGAKIFAFHNILLIVLIVL